MDVTSTVNVFTELAKQGPLIAALATAIWYFYNRQNKYEEQAQKQVEKIETLLKEDRTEMMKIIENNTSVMQENTRVLKSLYKHSKAINDE